MPLNHLATKTVATIKAKKAYNLLDEIFAHMGQMSNRTRSDNIICSLIYQTKALELTKSTIPLLRQSTYQGTLESVVHCIPWRQTI